MRNLAFLAVIALMPASAFARGQAEQPRDCLYTPAILAAADFLLTEPAVTPNFWRDRMGDDAAYLKIRYASLAYGEGTALLESLQRRTHPPQRILELRLAFAKTPDRMKLLAAVPAGANHGSVLNDLGESAWYALVLEDGGDWLFGELTRWQAADPYGLMGSSFHEKLPEALADLDDEAKSGLARRAEDAGDWRLALNLLALKSNLTEYLSYLDRLPPADPNDASSAQEKRERGIIDALNSNIFRPSFDISVQPPEVQSVDRKHDWNEAVRQLGKLATYAPDTAMLFTILNQLGQKDLGTVVAFTLNSRIEAGQLDPVNEPDALISAMISGLDLTLGRNDREKVLAQFGLSGVQGETAGEFIDRALARLAFEPFMRGEAADPPSRPAQITSAFGWAQWVGLAERLKAGEPIAPDDGIIAADLLVAAGKPLDALALLESATNWKVASMRAHRLMRSLDTRCNELLSHPIPTSEPLYRFGPR